ncbi:DUF4393 domain-containing protein [Mycolicibacterium fluoranthenivorans]|jgi:hypothetical protein|uniref:DUF4393 domain-containing protein n=1 Tax=Mycolicibacterium fluoranthenivorans TaxID=258505 RepID=A0A1G4X1Z9_9MYCO|nr:Abi-alpha family protein [Mycolicibacterium fluoranthenivorans]QNJ90126.1 DUF4393 domain-containing protein [Mycolicibacterium fluoranthenivorans]SCX33984.1 protein of unknown function [Mycolicibacterium fluoranthenivorans]
MSLGGLFSGGRQLVGDGLQFIGGGLQLVGRTVNQVPRANEVLPLLADVERSVVRAVRQHLEELDPPAAALTEQAEDEAPTTPTLLLRSLLDRSMYTSPDSSRDVLYLNLLQALVPDEARILAALSDGSAYPVIHIAEPGVGNTPSFVLKNASTVGRQSGVSLPMHTPLYLTRMLALGLVRLGPEASSMYDEYEMLQTDHTVTTALGRARRGMRAARVIRRTVSISDLGQELWEAAK